MNKVKSKCIIFSIKLVKLLVSFNGFGFLHFIFLQEDERIAFINSMAFSSQWLILNFDFLTRG